MTRIRAAVFDGTGTISVEEVDLAAPGPGEVRVKVAAAGVCHSDLHVTTRAWDVPAPVVLGHEGSAWSPLPARVSTTSTPATTWC